MSDQSSLDQANRRFWEEPCGSGLARSMGLADLSASELARFDEQYYSFYPWLTNFINASCLSGRKVLEIGPGFGTVAASLIDSGSNYTALDVADAPLRLIHHRAALMNHTAETVTGSILSAPFQPSSFDAIVAIGCLHHTGHLPRAVAAIYNLLRPGGIVKVMVYHRFSLRRLVQNPGVWLRDRLIDHPSFTNADESLRKRYDHNEAMDAAPATCFSSRRDLTRLFSGFRQVEICQRNCVNLIWRKKILLRREQLFSTLGKFMGLDLYLTARK